MRAYLLTALLLVLSLSTPNYLFVEHNTVSAPTTLSNCGNTSCGSSARTMFAAQQQHGHLVA